MQIEKLKKEKESNQIKIDNFENDSKSLDKLIGSQITNKSRKGVGFESYNDIVPPPTGLFAPPTIDLSTSGLEEFQQPEFEGYGVKVNKSVSENSSNEIKKSPYAPIIEEWVFDCDEDESEVMGDPQAVLNEMCDKKNSVLFTETECLILSPDFKLPNENQVLLKVPRKNNMYSFDLKNVVPSKGLTCLFAKATNDESKLWHRRLGHINFKTMNKLVKGNLVRGLPSNIFENDHTCVACQKGKQHKATFSAGNRTNGYAGLETNSDAGQAGKEKVPDQEYILLPLFTSNAASSSFTTVEPGRERGQRNEFESLFGQDKDASNVYRVFTPVNATTPSNTNYPTDLLMLDLEDTANL
ncbi:ribonuclease H-like domain-containing protein [Tanacetum coccineum]